MGRRSFLKHFVPFPGASPFLTATVLRPSSGQLPLPQYVYPVAYGGPVFGQRGCRRASPRAGRESGEHGSRGLWRMQWLWPVGPREGGVSMHAEHAAGHDSLPYRHRAAADGLSEIAPLCEDGRSKKSLCPVLGHRQEKQAGEGGVLGGSPLASTAEMRPDGSRRPCPLRRRKLRASTAEMRPNGGRRPCPLAGKTPHGITGNEEGALKVSAVGDTGPTDIAGRMRGSLSSSKAGCPGRYALRGRPARWAKPMRAWVSLAAVKPA